MIEDMIYDVIANSKKKEWEITKNSGNQYKAVHAPTQLALWMEFGQFDYASNIKNSKIIESQWWKQPLFNIYYGVDSEISFVYKPLNNAYDCFQKWKEMIENPLPEELDMLMDTMQRWLKEKTGEK